MYYWCTSVIRNRVTLSQYSVLWVDSEVSFWVGISFYFVHRIKRFQCPKSSKQILQQDPKIAKKPLAFLGNGSHDLIDDLVTYANAHTHAGMFKSNPRRESHSNVALFVNLGWQRAYYIAKIMPLFQFCCENWYYSRKSVLAAELDPCLVSFHLGIDTFQHGCRICICNKNMQTVSEKNLSVSRDPVAKS